MSAETQVEVFGTKEVSVKEFMGSSDKSLVLLSDYEKAKENLEQLKDKHQSRVEELVSIEKLSPKENKELNSIRAELREPRYLIQNIEKNNISVFESYKKTDKANLKGLIEINVDLEDKATEKLQAEDKRKKEEKEAEAKADELRIAKIKNVIDTIETYCYEVIQKMTFENLEISTALVEKSLNEEYDFEEFYLLLDQVKERVVKQLLEKTNDITQRENQRLENEAMKIEIFEVRLNRLKEVGYFADGLGNFVHSDFSTFLEKDGVYNCTSEVFEKTLSDTKLALGQIEQAKRDAELKKQKDEQFEIRKNRLAEIGFIYNGNMYFYFKLEGNTTDVSDATIEATLIEEADIMNFEQRLSNAKLLIADIKKQKAIDLKLAEEDAERLKKENKARVKRLATDKEIIAKSFEVYFADLHLETENQETKDFIESANAQVQELKSKLLTKLNEL
jgi:hypothetical protein